MDNLIPLLKELLLQIQEWVQTAAPTIWGIAYKKTIADIVLQISIACIFMIVLIVGTMVIAKKSEDWKELSLIPATLSFICLWQLVDGIAKLIAIEYYTILNIQNLITGLIK